jgi:hypothetical protein
MLDCSIDLIIQRANAIKLFTFLQAKGKLFANGFRSQAAMSSIAGMDKVSIIPHPFLLEIYQAFLKFIY